MTTYAQNRKARFNYEILETFEAGIELLGFEVKSIKAGHGLFDGAHVTVRGGEAFVINLSIPPYQQNNVPGGYEPRRMRRLLLKKKELHHLASQEEQRGLTIVPLSLYGNKSKIKIEIAIVRGKKNHDKKEVLKSRDIDREVRRELKDR